MIVLIVTSTTFVPFPTPSWWPLSTSAPSLPVLEGWNAANLWKTFGAKFGEVFVDSTLIPWTPKPWKMKVFIPKIWVIPPKNDGCGFPWIVLCLGESLSPLQYVSTALEQAWHNFNWILGALNTRFDRWFSFKHFFNGKSGLMPKIAEVCNDIFQLGWNQQVFCKNLWCILFLMNLLLVQSAAFLSEGIRWSAHSCYIAGSGMLHRLWGFPVMLAQENVGCLYKVDPY